MALLQVKSLPDVVVATLTVSRLDDSTAQAVGKELSALAGQLGERELRLDLGAVKMLTSVGLGKLLSLYKQVLLGGGQLTLCNVGPEVYELFAITRLTEILDVHAQEAAHA